MSHVLIGGSLLLVPLVLAASPRAQEVPAAALPASAFAIPRGVVWVDRPRADEETIWVRGDNYKASVDGSAFTFVPYLGAEAERNHPIAFRLRSASVGGVDLDRSGAVVSSAGDRITVARRDLVEVYDLAAGHVKQSLRLDRLPVRGALEIVFDVATDLVAAQDGMDLQFNGAGGTVRYADLVVFDAAGHRRALPIEQNSGQVRLRVPADFVEQAELPLVVDPVLSNTTVAIAADSRLQPDLAWNETAGEHLVVWQVPFSATDMDVAAIRTDSWTNPIGAPFFIDATTQNWVGPRVACKTFEGMFLVVAQVSVGNVAPWWISGRRYQAIGSTRQLFPQFDIERSTLSGHITGDDFRPDVGADPWANASPAFFTVVYEHRSPGGNGDIHLRQLAADGSRTSSVASVLNFGANDDQAPTISKSSGQGVYGIAWTQHGSWGSNGAVVIAVIDYHGVLRVPPSYLDNTPNDDSRPRVSTPAENPGRRTMLVTWQRNYDPFTSSGALHCAAITDQPQYLINRFNLSTLLGVPAGTQAFEPVVDSDGLRFAVAHSEILPAAPGLGRVDARISTLAVSGNSLLVHEARAVLRNTGPNAFTPSIASRYGGGLLSSRSYGVVCGSTAISVLGWLYNGHAPGTFFTVRGGGCGGLSLNYNGYPVFGHSVDLSVGGSGAFKGIVLGFPMPLTAIPGCPGCTMGVNGVSVAGTYSWVVPYMPAMVNTTLSAQGFSFGPTGPCFNAVTLTNVVDFTVR